MGKEAWDLTLWRLGWRGRRLGRLTGFQTINLSLSCCKRNVIHLVYPVNIDNSLIFLNINFVASIHRILFKLCIVLSHLYKPIWLKTKWIKSISVRSEIPHEFWICLFDCWKSFHLISFSFSHFVLSLIFTKYNFLCLFQIKVIFFRFF